MSVERIREAIELHMEALRVEWSKADEMMDDKQRDEWRSTIQHSINSLSILFREMDEASIDSNRDSK